MYVPGNSYRDVAEFNWWFAPNAASTVLRSGIPAYIIPLDATNKIPLALDTYTEIATHEPATIITELYRDAFAPFFGPGPPPYPLFVFDTLALAYLVDPSPATDVRTLYVDVNTNFDAEYGKALVYPGNPPGPANLATADVIFSLDVARFNALYVDLLTRPVPVQLAP